MQFDRNTKIVISIFIFVSAASEKQLTIERSESFNQPKSYVAANAHDGDYNTLYSVKDGAVAGNFLKLYLLRAYSIGEVKMISRHGNDFAERMKNTEVMVYSTKNVETKVSSCGKITGDEFYIVLFVKFLLNTSLMIKK